VTGYRAGVKIRRPGRRNAIKGLRYGHERKLFSAVVVETVEKEFRVPVRREAR